jgi:T3SS negative regulator,GrlR
MKDGLYLVSIKGFDGVDWPPRGVAVFRNGLLLGGGPYVYYTGSYSFRDGTIKGELVLNQHTPPPSGHLFMTQRMSGWVSRAPMRVITSN